MADAPDYALNRLRQENEEVHRANLDLLLRQSELIHENQQLWEFVMRAKRFCTLLQKSDYHSDSGEYIRFLMGFDRLREWTRGQLEALEQEADKEQA